MLGKNRKYKELDFSDQHQRALQKEYGRSYALQEKHDDLASRTEEYINANYHGGILSHSLYGVRYLNFAGVGIGRTKKERGEVLRWLQDILSLPHGLKDQEYFDLYWETDDGQPRTCKAKVSQALSCKHQLKDYKFDYTFQLACPSEKVYGLETKTKQIPRGFFGWVPLQQGLDFAMSGFGGGGKLVNEGNRYAPVKIQIVGTCTNPKIYNLTTGEVIRIESKTENLIFDNRNLDFKEGKDWILENYGQDISAKRSTWKDLYLAPGENHIVVITDMPTENPEIYVTWRDTFNY